MEYIKIPIRVKKSVWAGDIEDAYGTLLCGMLENAPFPMASEIVNAVNQHDALVAACVVSRQMLADIAKYYDVILQDVGMDAMVRRVEQATRVALALVKGDQKSDDADQD